MSISFRSEFPRPYGRLQVEALEDRSVPAVIADPVGDFLPTYVGVQAPGLDVVAHEVDLIEEQGRMIFYGKMAGSIAELARFVLRRDFRNIDPASARVMSLAMMKSTCLRTSFARPRSTGSPLSAANPTRTGLVFFPRMRPSSARMSGVLTSRRSSGPSDFSILPDAACCGV